MLKQLVKLSNKRFEMNSNNQYIFKQRLKEILFIKLLIIKIQISIYREIALDPRLISPVVFGIKIIKKINNNSWKVQNKYIDKLNFIFLITELIMVIKS